jgi:hypothetical protein
MPYPEQRNTEPPPPTRKYRIARFRNTNTGAHPVAAFERMSYKVSGGAYMA